MARRRRKKAEQEPPTFTVDFGKHGKFRKLTKEEMIACETERDHEHQDSNTITSALIVISCEQSELEKEILRMSVLIAGAKQKQKFLEAKRVGLNRVLNKRNTSC